MLARTALVVLAWCLALPVAGAEDDLRALLDDAVAAIDWEFGKAWAYTETALSEGERRVARFDPRVNENHGWTLLSVDGKEPSDRQRREFLHEKDEQHSESSDDDNRVTAIVDPETLELVEETDTHWVLAFVPAEDEQAFLDSVDARVRIAKDGRYIESLQIDNFQDIRPGFGTKLTEFKMRLLFGPAVKDGPVVPKSIDVHVKGRALLFIGFDETEVTRYSDFEYAGA